MRFGWVTLNVGEQALVYELEGQAHVEIGPKRFFLWRQKIVYLRAFQATQSEYLVISYRSGKLEHKLGPCVMFENPVEHNRIIVEKGIQMDADEVLVVYRHNASNGSVDRYIVHGPTTFFPRADEWLHNFCWHGTDPKNKTNKIPGILNFTKLKVIPDQFYFNVDEVRTADHALMRVKLMFFYELKDIERMLNATRDPIADFINCLTADVVSFASKLTYVEFIEKAHELNDLDKFPQLLESCKMIGYEVSKVVFRGYHAAPALQAMHDQSVQARTELKIAYETEVQKQAVVDMNMAADLQREDLERSMALESLRHKHELEKKERSHSFALKKHDCQERVNQKSLSDQARLLTKKEKDVQILEYYKKLQDLDVNLTDYILSQSQRPNKVIQFVAAKGATNLHWHQASA